MGLSVPLPSLGNIYAVVIIALFYTADLSLPTLGLAAFLLVCLIGLNHFGVKKLWPYLILGAVLWVAVLQSGVHATLAGVALALTIPVRHPSGPGGTDNPHSPLHSLEHAMHPWVGYGVVPIFGFANAGVSFTGLEASALAGPVPLGIALGLIVGKQIGVFGTAWATVRLGYADKPDGATMPLLHGVALLRHRIHHEPVHRRAGLCRFTRVVGCGEDRRARWLDHLRSCPGWTVFRLLPE